jgi:hypothetical protein
MWGSTQTSSLFLTAAMNHRANLFPSRQMGMGVDIALNFASETAAQFFACVWVPR